MNSTPLILSALAIASLSLPGCGNGQSRNAATAQATISAQADVTKSKQELDALIASLTRLRDASDTADVAKLHADLSDRARALRSSLSGSSAAGEEAVSAGRDQIARWHKDADGFTDAGLRESSSKREAELRGSVDTLAISNASLKSASDAYLARVDQSLTALDLDPSRKGVESIKPVISRLVDDEPVLRSALTDVATRSDAVHAVVSP